MGGVGFDRRDRVRHRLLALLLVTVCTSVCAPAYAQEMPGAEAGTWDPLEGMDPDGRIPRVERPEQIEHPARWRYIPEGRIKPGNLFKRFLVSSFIAPFVFRDSDVGWGGGISITDVDFRQQRRREFAGLFASYTSEGQQGYQVLWRRWMHHIDLPEGGVLQEERSFYQGFAGYNKTLTRRFFGLGPDSDEDDETSYSDAAIRAEFGFRRAIPDPGDDLVLGLGLRAELHNLDDGKKSGVPSTANPILGFPVLFNEAENANLGWIQADLRWDTRDSQTNPYRGWFAGGDIDVALVQNDGDVGARYTLGAGKVFPLPGLYHDGGDADEENPPTDTLVFNFWGQLSSGKLPFFTLPTLGGSVRQRGYVGGRWRDRSAWQAAVEYRFWVIPRGFPLPIPFTRGLRVERIGLAGFYEGGHVADDFAGLFDARMRHSYGVGLRALLERAAPFRVDFGFSEEGMQVTANFGLPF